MDKLIVFVCASIVFGAICSVAGLPIFLAVIGGLIVAAVV